MAESKDCGCRVERIEWQPAAYTPSEGELDFIYCPLHAAAPALVEALEALTATMTDQENLEQYRDCLATPWAGPLVDARRALAAARGEEESR